MTPSPLDIMKDILLVVSLVLITVGAALPLLVVMGGGNHTDADSRREYLITNGSSVDRWLQRGFFWVADHRLLLAVLGLGGLVLRWWW